MRHFAISAANFSISTFVLQKQHSFINIKDDFLKSTNTKIRSKPIYTQILSLDTYEMPKRTPVMTRRKYH